MIHRKSALRTAKASALNRQPLNGLAQASPITGIFRAGSAAFDDQIDDRLNSLLGGTNQSNEIRLVCHNTRPVLLNACSNGRTSMPSMSFML